MRVRVSARSIIQVPFLFSADRPFAVGQTREIEVLEQDDDPPPIVVRVKNHTTGAMQEESRPDPDRMGRTSYAKLVADDRLSVHESGGVDAAISGAEVAAARSEVARVAALNLDLTTENARLLARISDLEAASVPEKKGKKSE